MSTRFGASWVGQQPRRRPVIPTYTRPVRGEGFYSAPGWREVDMTFTLGEGESYRDPAVTKAIRTFDPDMIPVWVRWVFMSPNDQPPVHLEVFGRHAIARYVKDPHYLHPPIPVGLIPGDYTGPVPNQLDLIFEGEPDPRGADLPGAFRPWDWTLYATLRRAYNAHMTVQELKQKALYEPEARRQKQLQTMRDEFDYQARDLRRYAQRQLDRVSEVEAKEFFMGGKFVRKPRPTYFTPAVYPQAEEK